MKKTSESLTYGEMLGSTLQKGRVLDSEQVLEEMDVQDKSIRGNILIEREGNTNCPVCKSNKNVVRKGLNWLKSLNYNQKMYCKSCKKSWLRDYAKSKISKENQELINYFIGLGYSFRMIQKKIKSSNGLVISHAAIADYVNNHNIERPKYVIYKQKRNNNLCKIRLPIKQTVGNFFPTEDIIAVKKQTAIMDNI